MPNDITPTGLVTQTQAELITQFTALFQDIYGGDIDLSPSSPDGEMMMGFIQTVLDSLDLDTQIYNSFDPDAAFGVTLDARVAYNGIQRQAGTYTVTNVTITVSQAITLYGLDQALQQVYTVADNAGNQWQLESTQTPSAPGAFVYSFRSAVKGAVLTVPNTITVPVTVVLGVVTINNPTTYSSLGVNEETDAALKVRRQKSVSFSSQGYLAGLLAALENINGVSAAFVYENDTASTDMDGVPSHSIWVIVGGTGEDSEIANAIYRKRNAGCGMFGDITYVITQVDGSPFVVRWSEVEAEDLFIEFTATSLDGVNAPNITLILTQLPVIFVPGVFEQVNINDLATLVQSIDPNTLVTDAGFSTTIGGSYTPALSPSAKNKQFVVSAENIVITPIILSPAVVSVVHGGSTQQFTPLGGRAPYTYSIDSGNGSVDSDGLYTSGIVGTDVVKVVDDLGNIATSTVHVT